MAEQPRLPSPIGEAPSFRETLNHVSRVAPLDRPVLVVGERGTGKELIAARLHYLSKRWQGPFVKVNCAALPESLLDSELFGFEAGSFTGATRRHIGRLEQADGGTLFLDEIATASQAVQEKLLRAVEYGEVERIGGPVRRVDARVVGATNADLPALAAVGKFRADLLDRLAFDVVSIPPLRARIEDIPLLAEHFGRGMAVELGRDYFPGFTERALEAMCRHPWPGNVRELRNAIERSVAAAPDGLAVDRLILDPFASPWREVSAPAAIAEPPTGAGEASGSLVDRVNAHERAILSRAFEAARHNQRRTAEALGLGYHQLRHYLRKHGLIGGDARSTDDAEG